MMLSIIRNRCVLKSYLAEIRRNISGSTSLTNSYAFSCNKQADFLKKEQKLTNGTSLQLKKYQSNTAGTKDELQKIMAVFPDIVKDLTEDRNICIHPDVSKLFSELLQYNVPHGKKYRIVMMMETYKMLAKPEDQTPENIRLAIILGWCLEMGNAGILMCDDMIDGSEIRRGAPCWYKKDGIGLLAANDLFLMTGGVYAILRKYFHDKPYYVDILDAFQDTFFKTAIGQALDTSKSNKLELFTDEYFDNIAKYKTSFYSLILPVQMGMNLAGCASDFEQVKPILFDIGNFFQVENDILDCFGDPKITGKIGTDIQESKCSWLAVKALQKASPEQRKIMKECYGSSDSEKVAAVKNVYIELDLQRDYAVYKNDFMSNIRSNIQKISNVQQRKLLLNICEIFKV